MRAFAIFAGVALIGAMLFTIFSFTATPAAPSPAAEQPSRETLQERLKRVPGDHRGWAELASQYVDQARVTGDPSFYGKAEGALATAAKLNAGDDAVLTSQAALAAGRHEFTEAARLAGRAIDANPYGAAAYGVLADAKTQLGDLRGAQRAVDEMLGLRPGVAAFARASYAAELRGDTDKAREYLEYAHNDAFTPADQAYARYYLGELALHAGDLKTAADWYAKALRAYPAYTPALAGQARTAALGGDLNEALDLYDTVVKRLPLPQYLIEQGETRIKAGQPADWTLLQAQRKLFAAAGVRDDLTWAEFEADHGDPAAAVRHARAEYDRNRSLVAADALAWALLKAGKPAEALPYAKEATATGWRNPLLSYHRAVIEQALGRPARVDPTFDPTLPALARFS
ncbi:Tetratricopeptide repeat-containing protein [Nonomuraea solani]|uniref:Tetratricopeptide repeat-containing protein n=1 Tax=Nonomuraea solani TaxID=1144553 RepID=A0A1H6B5N4_9ACTN|nr:tetratricopeptide repeat protein [Nonomuraea solani]SEG56153.1 Tetratricopeptide repeat-containing protein [Nonomuraea solani]